YTEWQKIAENIKAELKGFSKDNATSESMEESLNIATREKYDYSEFLRKFMVMSETMAVNDDEFDYIYYTYGMKLYDNMPLIEPLEYKDSNKIKDFVIAIDTSASCKGELVTTFLEKTVSIMQDSENFFSKINVHILECDNQVRNDTVITSREDFSQFMNGFTVKGFGSTDFRPVFDYVDNLILKKELKDLKGLIYFTDGYGVYPEKKKEYDVAFVFVNDDDTAPKVPAWAIKVVLSEEDIGELNEH
ncbi:MAG: VWA-like domain-containing protein, partial [Lachnospiraceae bacterium]|nr:VWA-like domain-containing protein [Lachnospiraceae bacterium]